VQTRQQDTPVFPVLAVSFIGAIGYSIVLPFLVFLVTRLGGNALVYGLLGATYPLFQLFGAPVLGRWSDLYGRRRVLLLSQVGTLLSWIVFSAALFLPEEVLASFGAEAGLVLTLPVAVLFLARALDGLTGGNVSVANAYLADISDEEHRSENFGKMSAASNVGFIAGPALAGVLGATAMGEGLPVLAALIVSLVGTVVVARLPEPDPCAADPGPASRTSIRKVFGLEPRNCVRASDDRPGALELLRTRGLGYVLALYFLVFLGFNFFYTAFPVHAARGLGWTVLETGAFFGVLSFLMVLVQGPLLKRIAGRVPETALIVAGSAVLGLGFIALTSPLPALIYVGAALFALGNGVMWPSMLSVLSGLAGDEHQGSVHGLAGAIGSLASILGLVAGGVLYGLIGEATFLISAGTVLGVALLSTRLWRLAPRTPLAPEGA